MPSLIRPRLNDYYELPFTQEQVNFAIPLLDDDVPLFVDPFLLWKSPSQQDRSLHREALAAFDRIARGGVSGDREKAIQQLIAISECAEAGLGSAKQKKGRRIGRETASDIIELYRAVPQVATAGIEHIETLQLLVGDISRDRISDITCSLLKSFLIDFTQDNCRRHQIPTEKVRVGDLYDDQANALSSVEVDLPVNPHTKTPILLIPRRWLRRQPWISPDEFVRFSIEKDAAAPQVGDAVLHYNRDHYDMVLQYIQAKERVAADCKNDPLFKPIPIVSAKRKLSDIKKLPTGKTDNADKKYEDAVSQLLASLLYPELDFADEQSRTDSGTTIRDLIFYNNRTQDFLQDIYNDFNARQLVFELKNVAAIEREHINQLNRYLDGAFGRFGVFVTRKELPRAMRQHTIDLWSGPRKCIIALTDEDLSMMVNVFESKQRLPVEILKRAFVTFTRQLPG
ncbi:MAG TPA: hypothetical protein VGJ18_00125 [Gemmatimonadaceae bacterium]|jgi:hypothetical protein